MVVPQASLLVILGLAFSSSAVCEEAKKSEKPKNAPENALASCVVSSHSCRSAEHYTHKKGEHGLELVFNSQPSTFTDYWHNLVSEGHYKSTYWAVSDDHAYFSVVSRLVPARIEDMVEVLLDEQAAHCNVAVECHSLENSTEDGYLKPEVDDGKKPEDTK